MNIVHLITYLDSQTGGMERQALQLAGRLNKEGYHSFFITCAHWDKMRKHNLKFRGSLNKIPVYRIPLIRSLGFLNAFIYFSGAILYLILLRKRYSFIHAHQLYTSGLTACIAKLLLPSKKIIIKNCAGNKYGDVNNLRKFPFSSRIISFMSKRADTFVGVSDEVIKEMKEIKLEKLTLIPNGVDIGVFVPASVAEKDILKRKILAEASGKKVILFVGRLGPEKNILLLLKAITLINLNVILLVVGEGSIRGELERYAQSNNIQDRVAFLGAQDDIIRFYQIADIFVLPSESEGLPNVLLEAMSCGIPSVGSDIDGIRAVIRHKHNGYLFEKTNAEKLTGVISEILTDNYISKSLSKNSRKTIEDSFSLESVAKKYIVLYNILLSN